jgi:deazaflavin-dependent oxidoreductase (nitroreductase family)
MVLLHTGRKTGKRRMNNLNYALIDGVIFCTAGFGRRTDWYQNILQNPSVEIWLYDGWWHGFAEDVTSDPRKLVILRQVLRDSGFASRVAGINPNSIPDDNLDELTSNYCLVRITRTSAGTGPGGPGKLSWIWPFSTVFLLLYLLYRRLRCRE